MPGEAEQSQSDGTSNSRKVAHASGQDDLFARAYGTEATHSALERSLVKRRVKGEVTPTTITATVTPPEQFVGRAFTIAGQLASGGGAHLVGVPVVLYKTDDPTNKVCVAKTVTDASGHYQFTLRPLRYSVATTHVYTVCAEGRSNYSRAQSPEVLVKHHFLRLR
ncbi:MAG: hypothetical protein ACXV5G_10110, partial [Halobacteriota archaeon]